MHPQISSKSSSVHIVRRSVPAEPSRLAPRRRSQSQLPPCALAHWYLVPRPLRTRPLIRPQALAPRTPFWRRIVPAPHELGSTLPLPLNAFAMPTRCHPPLSILLPERSAISHVTSHASNHPADDRRARSGPRRCDPRGELHPFGPRREQGVIRGMACAGRRRVGAGVRWLKIEDSANSV